MTGDTWPEPRCYLSPAAWSYMAFMTLQEDSRRDPFPSPTLSCFQCCVWNYHNKSAVVFGTLERLSLFSCCGLRAGHNSYNKPKHSMTPGFTTEDVY